MLHTRKEQMEAFGRFLDILDRKRKMYFADGLKIFRKR